MKLVRPILGSLAVLGIAWSCKTVPSVPTGSALRDTALTGMSAEQKKAWDPCGGAERLSTVELQRRIETVAAIASGKMSLAEAERAVGKIHTIDPELAAGQMRQNAQGFVESGGLFDLRLHGNGNPLIDGALVRDNSFRYVWDTDGPGQFLPPDVSYNHVIPQYNDVNQPEMIKYLKDGDIIVYFHPEYRSGAINNHEQWRATHAATIQEVPSDDPDVPCKLQTIDVPAGYARAFDGNSSTPFHVFRFMSREQDAGGNYKPYDEEKEFWLRSQITRWGSIAFAKHPFNNYQAFDMRFPSSDIVDGRYVHSYLTQGPLDGLGMYCAWFVYANANLAWMRPMNHNAFSQGRHAEVWNALYSGETSIPYENNLQISHRSGDGSIANYYALPESVVARYAGSSEVFNFKNEFAFEPMTAPEMAIGFIDKVVGPDYDLLQYLEAMDKKVADGTFTAEDMANVAGAYMKHLNLKVGMITQMRRQLTGLFQPQSSMANLYLLNQDPRIPQETDSSIRETLVQEYSSLIGERYDYIIKRYSNALQIKKNAANDRINFAATGPADQQRLLEELQGADPKVVLASMVGYLRGIRSHIYGLIQKERSGKRDYQHDFTEVAGLVRELGNGQEDLNELRVFGKKWVPPYSYVRIAENHEAFYLNKRDSQKHRPRLAYVGTVVPAKFLGREEPIKDIELTAAENEVVTAASARFGGNNINEMTANMFEALVERGDQGFNEHETLAIRAMRAHWNPDAESAAEISRHNRYGIGPNLFFRVLVNYWNQPTDPDHNVFRPAIYDGSVSSIAGATENLRLLQQDPVHQLGPEPVAPEENSQVHPRRVTPLPCIAMEDVMPDPDSFLCSN